MNRNLEFVLNNKKAGNIVLDVKGNPSNAVQRQSNFQVFQFQSCAEGYDITIRFIPISKK